MLLERLFSSQSKDDIEDYIMCNLIVERLTLVNPDGIFPVENKRSRLLLRPGIYLSRENDTKVMFK